MINRKKDQRAGTLGRSEQKTRIRESDLCWHVAIGPNLEVGLPQDEGLQMAGTALRSALRFP
jgi:hypothetical protein